MSQTKTLAYWSDGFSDHQLEIAKYSDENHFFGTDHHKLIDVPEGSTKDEIANLVAEKILSDVANGPTDIQQAVSLADRVFSTCIAKWTEDPETLKVRKTRELIQKTISPNQKKGKSFTPMFIGEVSTALFERAVNDGYLIDHGNRGGRLCRYELKAGGA